MSNRRQFLQGVSSLPLATILASPTLAATAAAGLEEVTAKLSSGATIKAALAKPDQNSRGDIVLIHEWWGLVY